MWDHHAFLRRPAAALDAIPDELGAADDSVRKLPLRLLSSDKAAGEASRAAVSFPVGERPSFLLDELALHSFRGNGLLEYRHNSSRPRCSENLEGGAVEAIHAGCPAKSFGGHAAAELLPGPEVGRSPLRGRRRPGCPHCVPHAKGVESGNLVGWRPLGDSRRQPPQ